jgi:hypothetical protein
MPFDDVDHFEAVFRVLEEDYIAFKGCASEIGSEFRALPAHLERKRGEVIAVSANAEDEFSGNV